MLTVLRRIHLVVGVVSLVGFAVSGGFMALRYDHLKGMADGPRLLFRSAHIYLLMAALLNVLLGVYLVPQQAPWRRRLQATGGVLVAIAPFLFALAFLREPHQGSLERPYAGPGIYACFGGVLLQLFTAFRWRAR